MKTCARFTIEEIKEIRDRFYYGEPITIRDLGEQWGNRVAETNFIKLIKGIKYELEEWTYPDFDERKKEYKKHMYKIYIKDISSGMGVMNFMEKWNVSATLYYAVCKTFGYKPPKRYGRNRPPIEKIVVS
jgi:hypothetical protein